MRYGLSDPSIDGCRQDPNEEQCVDVWLRDQCRHAEACIGTCTAAESAPIKTSLTGRNSTNRLPCATAFHLSKIGIVQRIGQFLHITCLVKRAIVAS